jgi:hypothetical protein
MLIAVRLHIHSGAKEFKTRLFNDFANVEGFQQISVIEDDLDFVTRAAPGRRSLFSRR